MRPGSSSGWAAGDERPVSPLVQHQGRLLQLSRSSAAGSAVKRALERMARRTRDFALSPIRSVLVRQAELTLLAHNRQLQREHPNPLNRFGRQVFSQADEDGITLEILRRMALGRSGCFAEFGVGDGLQNNTLVLAALGWRGFWVGAEALAFPAPSNARFAFMKEWVTLDNVVQLARQGMAQVSAGALDVVSMDLDGNDIYFVERLLQEGVRPKLFIVEYNAKFPPPIEFQIDYDPAHTWAHDDYYGASLSSFNRLFGRFGYRLVCCNAHTGTNAFFVDADDGDRFADVPSDIASIYVECRFYTYHYGHAPSVKVPQLILRDTTARGSGAV